MNRQVLLVMAGLLFGSTGDALGAAKVRFQDKDRAGRFLSLADANSVSEMTKDEVCKYDNERTEDVVIAAALTLATGAACYLVCPPAAALKTVLVAKAIGGKLLLKVCCSVASGGASGSALCHMKEKMENVAVFFGVYEKRL